MSRSSPWGGPLACVTRTFGGAPVTVTTESGRCARVITPIGELSVLHGRIDVGTCGGGGRRGVGPAPAAGGALPPSRRPGHRAVGGRGSGRRGAGRPRDPPAPRRGSGPVAGRGPVRPRVEHAPARAIEVRWATSGVSTMVPPGRPFTRKRDSVALVVRVCGGSVAVSPNASVRDDDPTSGPAPPRRIRRLSSSLRQHGPGCGPPRGGHGLEVTVMNHKRATQPPPRPRRASSAAGRPG